MHDKDIFVTGVFLYQQQKCERVAFIPATWPMLTDAPEASDLTSNLEPEIKMMLMHCHELEIVVFSEFCVKILVGFRICDSCI